MRDELDARIWNDHHTAFTASIDRGLATTRRIVGELSLNQAGPRQLLVGLAALTLSLVSLGGTIA